MLNKYFFKRSKRFHQITALIVVLIVASIGTYLLTSSHAATPYVSATAESGTLTGNATKQSCSGSVDGDCVAFASPASSGADGTPWIGLNGYTGWGGTYNSPSGGTTTYQSLYYSDGFRWGRIDESGSECAANDEASQAEADGISVMLIIPENLSGAESCMNMFAQYGSKVIFEFGNEPFYNGVSVSTYATEYQQAYDYKHCITSTGAPVSGCTPITQPLLFMTTGNPGNVTGSNPNLFWLDAAVDDVPNLQVDGISAHTYDEAGEDLNNTSNGVVALVDEHADAAAIKEGSTTPFTNTPWYVTEYGFTLCDPESATSCPTTSSAATGWYVPSYCEQEKQLILGYNAMMAYGDGQSGTWLKGIMWYETHDNGVPIGDFGLVTDNATSKDNAGETIGHAATGSSIILRPAYTALKGYITSSYETPISCAD
jgi:hypothetical protein